MDKPTVIINPFTNPFGFKWADRFWSHVAIQDGDDPCWFWTASLHRGGYGQFRIVSHGPNRDGLMAHQASWILHFGKLDDGNHVLHNCDSRYAVGDVTYRKCVCPLHMFLGNQDINIKDAASKGRLRRGETNHWSKLNEESVVYARREFAKGFRSASSFAEELGVTVSCILSLLRNETWRHVELYCGPNIREIIKSSSFNQKLSTLDRHEIIRLFGLGMTKRSIADRFGISAMTVLYTIRKFS